MKVYVILATYNPEQWIEKCFNSLFSSSIDLNVIVVDNGSTDNSPLIIKRDFPQVEVIESKVNLGFGAANNIGINKAYLQDADFVFLLNQDAWVEHDTIEKLIQTSQRNYEYGILSPIHINGKGNNLDYNFSTFISAEKCKGFISDFVVNNPLKEIYSIPFVNAAAWLLTRKCIEIVGGFNPSFYHYAEDLNYAERVNYHSLKIGIVPKVKIFHDRQSRTGSPFILNDNITFKRILNTELSRPIQKKSLAHFYLVTLKNIIKSLIKQDEKLGKTSINRLRILLNTNVKNIKRNRQLSMLEASAFLDIKKG